MTRRAMDTPEATDCPPTSFTATSGSGEKNLWTQGIWTPIPANDPAPGTVYELSAGGVLTSHATTPGTLQFVMRLGTSATPSSNKSAGASTSITLTAALSGVPWYAKATFLYKTVPGNATATAASNGVMYLGNLTTTAARAWSFGSNAITAIDTTIGQALIFSVNFSQATTSAATCRWCYLRRLN